MNVTGFIAGTQSAIASPLHTRRGLAILNQSTSATLWIAFDQPAVAGQVAGQITIGPISPSGNQLDLQSWISFGAISTWQAIHIIASADNTPVTIIE